MTIRSRLGGLQRRSKRLGFHTLAQLERVNRKTYLLAQPPGFIVAPPRAGTTLVRSLLSTGLETSYFANFTATSARAVRRPLPVTTSLIVKRMGWTDQDDGEFTNSYGKIRGLGSPAEGELIWAYWFGSRHDAVRPGVLRQEQKTAMYQSVAAVESIFGAPFVNKTTVLALRIEALVEVFERAYFIRVRRSPIDTAQSIYIARTTRYRDWLGPRPPECVKTLDDDIVIQVAKQVHFVDKHIDEAAKVVGVERFLDVAYDDVCASPRKELDRIRDFMESRGVTPAPTRRVPDHFERSGGQKVDDVTFRRLNFELDRLAE